MWYRPTTNWTWNCFLQDHTHTHTHTHAHIHTYIYVCKYMYMYVCIYVCVCMCISFFCIIYWACSTTLGSTTCRFPNYVHWFPNCRSSKYIDSTNAQNFFWCLIMRSCLLTGQVPICCFRTSRWALVFAQWNRWSMECVYVYVYMYVCMCVCVCIYIYIYIYTLSKNYVKSNLLEKWVPDGV